MSLMNDNNDDDVDVGEVDGMGWDGERGCVGKTRHGRRAEGTGQRDVIGGEDADANRRSHSTSASRSLCGRTEIPNQQQPHNIQPSTTRNPGIRYRSV
jgi:hypothetical protein